MLKWATANEQATLSICADDNSTWSAEQAVVAPTAGEHLHVVQVSHPPFRF